MNRQTPISGPAHYMTTRPKSPLRPTFWTISGSDCSGGAGIAADIKTAQCLGVEICHLMTANTVQNSQQVLSVNPVDVSLLQQQFDCLRYDKTPQVIKIGLIASVEQISWLCEIIPVLRSQQPTLNVIYDPVGQASVGGTLSTLTAQDLEPLLLLVNLITPNVFEARKIATLSDIHNKETIENLAQSIRSLGVEAVIIKGGHTQDSQQCIDYCLTSSHTYQLCSPRINTNASHGGGCSFASAISCFIAHGFVLRDAFTLSKAFIYQGMVYSEQQYGSSAEYRAFEQLGWPHNKKNFPKIVSEGIAEKNQPAFLPLEKPYSFNNNYLGLYPVVDSLAWLKRLLPLKLNIIQLRIKNLSQTECEATIKAAVELSKKYSTQLFINDYWQLAIKYGAFGVHLGQEDLAEANVTAIRQAGLRLGLSTHGCYEFLLAQQLKPSYLAIGAIFPTKTKDMTGQIQGIENLKQTLLLMNAIPVVAIGGINHINAPEVLSTGVDSIAVVTAITESKAPEEAIAKFNDMFDCI